MFEKARIKLTAWYLLIIMIISIIFSSLIYLNINSEYKRLKVVEEVVRERIDNGFPVSRQMLRRRIDPETIKYARARLLTSLSIINLFILVLSASLAYFLAGRTLKPIKKMVDELNRFVSDASHELRTPLTSLRSEIEVALLSNKLSLTEAKNILRSNLDEVIKLQDLSDNLLLLAQSENTELDIKNSDLKKIIDDSVDSLKGKIKEKNIQVVNKVKKIEIPLDEVSIRRVFIILLDNAIKFSYQKGRIILESEEKDRGVVVRFIDFGNGVSLTDRENIFRRFYRGNKSREGEGFGLGLSIAQSIVFAHKGSIYLSDNKPKGSVFSIYLPKKYS